MVMVEFFFAAALLGGLVGTLAMTVFWYAARAMGWMSLDWGELLGTYFYPPGRRAMAVGLIWHFMTGLLFGVVYAFALATVGIPVTVLTGLVLGIIHSFVALGMLYFLPRIHPALAPVPATEIWNERDLALFALGFPIFGAVFGGTYAAYDQWASAPIADPARFWLTAFTVLAIALVIGIATYRLVPQQQIETGPIFSMASLSLEEQRAAVTHLYEQGDLSEEEYRQEIEAIDAEARAAEEGRGV